MAKLIIESGDSKRRLHDRRRQAKALSHAARLTAMKPAEVLRFICGLVEFASTQPDVASYPRPVARAQEIFLYRWRKSRLHKNPRG